MIGLVVVITGCRPAAGLLAGGRVVETQGEPLDCAVAQPDELATAIRVPGEDAPQQLPNVGPRPVTADDRKPDPKSDETKATEPATDEPAAEPIQPATQTRADLPTGPIEKQSRSVAVNGRAVSVRVLRVPLGSFKLRVGLARGRVGCTESLKDIAQRHNAEAAINGSFFDAYSNDTVKNPYGHLATGGQIIHIADHPATLGYWADGTAAIGAVKYKVQGKLDGDGSWRGRWYAYGMNDYPINKTLAQLYTPRWALGDTPGDGIQIVVRNGEVVSKAAGTHAIPNDGYVIYLRGEEKYLADRFTPGQKCAYSITAESSDADHKWAEVQEAMGCGPLLVRNGEVSMSPEEEGFRDPKILSGTGSRSAVGVTDDGYLLMATCGGVTVKQLAGVMKAVGAHDAMNLDGGASSCLYYDGSYLVSPGRNISNALLVVAKE